MKKKFPNRKPPRLKNWDYSSPGYYFVTTVTKNRILLFGNIENGKMILNEFGKIALEEWNKSFEIRKELSCDEYIIMPNHIHAILVIESDFPDGGDERPFVPTGNFIPTGKMIPKSISSFFAGYKSVVTKRINELRNTPKQPVWQSRFHDRIIRDEKGLYNIRKYIMNNPINWNENDEFEKLEFYQSQGQTATAGILTQNYKLKYAKKMRLKTKEFIRKTYF